MALVGVHGLQSHAALVLKGLGGHFLGQVHQRILPLAAVVLGVHADVHVLLAAPVEGVVHQVLDGVQGLAPAADHGAHVLAGEFHIQAAALPGGDGDVGLDVHALEEAAEELLHLRFPAAALVNGLFPRFPGGSLGGFGGGAGLAGGFGGALGAPAGGFLRLPLLLVGHFHAHADPGFHRAEAQKALLGHHKDFGGTLVLADPQRFPRGGGGSGYVFSACFSCLDH